MSCLGCLFSIQQEQDNRSQAKKYAKEYQKDVVLYKSETGWSFCEHEVAVKEKIPYKELLTYQ